MKNIKTYDDFINESITISGDGIDDKIKSSINVYRFDNKISQNRANSKSNALNTKEVIHKACDWCLDQTSHIFMFEIAMAETGLGSSSKSRATRGDIGRGLWHVDEGTFKWTQVRHARINSALDNLKKIGIDWSKIKWNDISNNILLGAIACKLVLLKKNVKVIDGGNVRMAQRAKLYATKYNAGGTAVAESNYVKNCKAWYKFLKDNAGVEFLDFNGKRYTVKDDGLYLN
jgi:hypothetical protein